jgi:DNA-binding transcriptional LysR family regulator
LGGRGTRTLAHYCPRARRRPKPECGYEAHRLGQATYVAVLSSGHPLLAKAGLALSDLAEEPWVQLTRVTALYARVSDVLESAGLNIRVAARVPGFDTAWLQDRSGNCWARRPAAAGPELANDRGVAPVAVTVSQRIGSAWRSDLVRWLGYPPAGARPHRDLRWR